MKLLIALLACSLFSGCGLVEVYGKREYSVERFRLVDEKTRQPISGAEVTVTTTHGLQSFPKINMGKPKDVIGRTDKNGDVSLRVTHGPKLERLAYGYKDGLWVLQQWETHWEKDARTGRIILLGKAEGIAQIFGGCGDFRQHGGR